MAPLLALPLDCAGVACSDTRLLCWGIASYRVRPKLLALRPVQPLLNLLRSGSRRQAQVGGARREVLYEVDDLRAELQTA